MTSTTAPEITDRAAAIKITKAIRALYPRRPELISTTVETGGAIPFVRVTIPFRPVAGQEDKVREAIIDALGRTVGSGGSVKTVRGRRPGNPDRYRVRYDIYSREADPLTPREPQRQFCRTGIHSAVPAVTLTFDNGTRRLHWCADHRADAEPYRASADGQDGA